MRKFHIIVLDDERGTTAVEFAIVGPVFIALVIGILYSCLCLFLVGSLHYAVEEGARCASVRSTTQCTDETTIKAYTQNHYYGPTTSPPALVYNPAATCGPSNTGHSVTGSISYVAQLGLTQFTIPITATACFP